MQTATLEVWDSREPTGLEDALAYAERGFSVFPCEAIDIEGFCTCGAADCDSPAKHPVGELAPHGFLNATTDADVIRGWWDARPGANVAIRTGVENGIVVLDEDHPHGSDSRADLERLHGKLPDTPRVLTGGGGTQYLFAHPGMRVPCSTGKLAVNLDVRGDGGYIVAPRSLHQSGRFYDFEVGASLDDLPLAPMPQWFVELACDSKQQERKEQHTTDGEIPTGQRNAKLTSIAGALRRQGCGFDEILAALKSTNETRCRPPLSDSEVVNIARSVMRYEPAQHESGVTQEERPRFTFVGLGNVLDMPPVDWLIEDFVPRGSFAVTAGFAGHAKSTLGLDHGLSVSTGTPWSDRAVRRGAVAYVAAEGWHGFGQRVRAWLKYHALPADLDPPIFFLADAPQLVETGDVTALLDAINRLPEKPVLIVIDTLARTFGAGDENTQRDMTAFVRGIDRLRNATGAAVEVLHHTGWNHERERGNSVLRGAADTVALILKEDNAVTLSCLKQKDAAPFSDLLFDLRVIGEGDDASVVLAPTTKAERKNRPGTLPETRRKALESLAAGDDGGGLSYTAWFEVSGLTKATFKRAVADLGSWGLIQKQAKKYRAVVEVSP
jgi:hypothetical protein